MLVYKLKNWTFRPAHRFPRPAGALKAYANKTIFTTNTLALAWSTLLGTKSTKFGSQYTTIPGSVAGGGGDVFVFPFGC
jgi:hypothetical protein